jgi:hypothetical protein
MGALLEEDKKEGNGCTTHLLHHDSVIALVSVHGEMESEKRCSENHPYSIDPRTGSVELPGGGGEGSQVREAMEGIQSLGEGVVRMPIMALAVPRSSQNSSSRRPAPTPKVAEKRFRKALRDLSAASILLGMQKGLRKMINSVKAKR